MHVLTQIEETQSANDYRRSREVVTDNTLEFGKGKAFKYDTNATITSIFEKQARNIPDYIAVCFKFKTLTFRDLNSRANQLANFLIRQGVKPQDCIGLYLEPGIETLIGILAILKMGGCYVPLDPLYPTGRLNYMLEDSGATAILIQGNLSHNLKTHSLKTIDVMNAVINKENSFNLTPSATAENTAYIIYTSGSTGTPKGVEIHHRAVINHMVWMQDNFSLSSNETVLFRTPLSFDPSVWEIMLPLFMGAKVVIAPMGDNIDPEKITKLIISNKITILQLVPTLLLEFLKQKNVSSCYSLRHVFCGGETLPSNVKRLFFNTMSCKLHNLYGPTEATIDITSHTFQLTESDMTHNIIGKPIYNTQLFILNKKMEICAPGEIGELYIASDSLSKGYHNLAKMNKERFIEYPIPSIGMVRMYKTGDRVKWLCDGNLEYIGRSDEQIKLNGARVEVKEIEAYILAHSLASNCKILKKLNQDNSQYLSCFIISKESEKTDLEEIKKSLKSFFPAYMLPKEYCLLKKFPLTINGKVDIQALLEIKVETAKQNIEQPCSQYEVLLKNIWKDILKNDCIDMDGNFFEMGGNSFLVLQLVHQIKKKLGISVSIRDIFLQPTIKEQAAIIENCTPIIGKINYHTSATIPNPIIPLQAKGSQTPLFLIHPIGGSIFWYTKLATLMGDSRPIYGIQDPGIELKKPIFTSIKTMAKFYAQAITETQPTGPYLIGGASFGATVALEIANQLKKQKHVVLSIIILDGWGVYPNTLLDADYFRRSMERQQTDIKAQFEVFGITEAEYLFALQWHRLGLLWKYQMKNIPFSVALYKAKEVLPAFELIEDPLNHWNQFAQQPINLYQVPGNHETMFYEPHVHILAELINCYLKGIDHKSI